MATSPCPSVPALRQPSVPGMPRGGEEGRRHDGAASYQCHAWDRPPWARRGWQWQHGRAGQDRCCPIILTPKGGPAGHAVTVADAVELPCARPTRLVTDIFCESFYYVLLLLHFTEASSKSRMPCRAAGHPVRLLKKEQSFLLLLRAES
jgi:hypothetical protein